MSEAMKRIFCRISKVDEEKRLVTGIGASEAIDADGEIFDYASSKPYIEAWSAGAFNRSGGKSYGNIREMHQLSAVGKLAEPVLFDDSNCLVILTAYISDDDAWKKCADGTYTGFSICGPVIGEKWADAGEAGAKRYTCAPVEFSVCDLPCNEEAVFTAVKAGGVTEERKFKGPVQKSLFYGTGSIDLNSPASGEGKEPPVAKNAQKSLWDVQDIASILMSLRWNQDSLAYERDQEGDNSPVPDKLKGAITSLAEVLNDLCREETAELVAAMKTAGSQKMIAKAKNKGVEAISKCMKALDDVSACMKGECEHGGIHECAKAIVDAHKTASDAMSLWADADEGDEGSGGETSGKAAGAPQSQGASPDNGEEQMNEAEKAQLAQAQKDAAESLRVATETQKSIEALGAKFAEGMEAIVKAVGSQVDPPKSAASAAGVTAVSKSQENGGAQPAADEPKTPESVAKAILANPRLVSDPREQINIGR